MTSEKAKQTVNKSRKGKETGGKDGLENHIRVANEISSVPNEPCVNADLIVEPDCSPTQDTGNNNQSESSEPSSSNVPEQQIAVTACSSSTNESPKLKDIQQPEEPQEPKVSLTYAVKFMSKTGADSPGEDAYVAKYLPDGRFVIAVADGVGDWARDGIDAALFSNRLLEHVYQTCQDKKIPVSEVLRVAFRTMRDLFDSGKEKVYGSSTVMVGVIDLNDYLRVSNIGDSQLMIIRNGRIALKTEPQQLSFNRPGQLGFDPFLKKTYDHTNNAEYYQVSLQSGDIVIMATDGLFDNVYDADILSEVRYGNAQDMARRLLVVARTQSKKTTGCSPFSDECNRVYSASDVVRYGGKEDDITIIVCVIP